MIVLPADIHGNREATAACLADAERYIFLGDLVGFLHRLGRLDSRALGSYFKP
jgi:hypothetical protein